MSKTLFLAGCIPTRILLVYIAFQFSYIESMRNLLSIITLLIGIGFFYIYFTGSRKTGVETGGQPIWWNNWRPVHGSLYILFAILNAMNVKNAWVVLALDVVVGVAAFIKHYYV